MTTSDLCDTLCDLMTARLWKDGPKSLGPYDAPFALVAELATQLDDAGLYSFFRNPTAYVAHETADALDRIGAPVSARAVRESAKFYFGEGAEPPDDYRELRRLISRVQDERHRDAEALERALEEADEPLYDLLERFLEANVARIQLTEDEAATATVLDATWRQCGACADAWELPRDERFAHCPSCGRLTVTREATTTEA